MGIHPTLSAPLPWLTAVSRILIRKKYAAKKKGREKVYCNPLCNRDSCYKYRELSSLSDCGNDAFNHCYIRNTFRIHTQGHRGIQSPPQAYLRRPAGNGQAGDVKSEEAFLIIFCLNRRTSQ